jgi:hypothetical protein
MVGMSFASGIISLTEIIPQNITVTLIIHVTLNKILKRGMLLFQWNSLKILVFDITNETCKMCD